MSINTRKQTNFLWLRLGIVFLNLILILGLLATSYKASSIFIFGILLFFIGWSLIWLGKKMLLIIKRKPILKRILLAGLSLLGLMMIAIILLSIYGRNQVGYMAPSPLTTTKIKDYKAFIEPVDESFINFVLKEDFAFQYTSEYGARKEERLWITKELQSFINEDERIKLAASKKMPFLINAENIIGVLNKTIELELKSLISSQDAGFALRKVAFTPLSSIRQSLPSPNNSSPLTIKINKLPIDSFQKAKNQKGDSIDKNTFLAEDTIKWSTDEISDDIEFTYFPFPYYYFSSFLNLFANISSLSKGIFIIFGLVSATVTTEIIKPIIVEKIQESVKQRLDKLDKKKEVSAQPEPEVTSGSSSVSAVSDQPEASTVDEVSPQVSRETKNNDKNDEPKQENP